ncbi:MAG: ATP-binding protein [Deltaproteobacteria bacterium]|nr:MAG: ATP-binding protein [Deltaproteobacteria bacterium]
MLSLLSVDKNLKIFLLFSQHHQLGPVSVAFLQYTNWYVITGAPCSGKTSVVRELEKRGYRVVHEVARAYIDEELNKGKRLEEIKSDALAFEHHILDRKIKIESSLPKDAVIFLDRAVPDSIAYFTLEGLNSTEPLEKSKTVRYKKVFLLERLVFEKDPARVEDESIATQLDRLIEDSYRMLGYDIGRVPVLSIKDRTDFILQRL